MLLDAFLKFEEPALEGESTDKGHLKEIEILSFEQAVVRTAPAGGGKDSAAESKARSEHQPMTIIKVLDKASPKIYQAACAGTVYGKVTLSVCQPSGTAKTSSDSWKKVTWWEVTMTKVRVSRIHCVGDPGLHRMGRATDFPISSGAALAMGPLEELDLTYETIKWLYKGGSGTMNFVGQWNLKSNAPT